MKTLLCQGLSFLSALWFAVAHLRSKLCLTVVRRYADAQGNYVGELYEGDRMVGASLDRWPLDADARSIPAHPNICYTKSFLEPLPPNTLRVGSFDPADNASVQAYVARRRFLPVGIEVRNRFVEHILESKRIA